ncbi:hypothetical protein NCC49_005909 [Naganishia albida]|nr:hypothetical protein NCC49_005909 [Naganishia albida]
MSAFTAPLRSVTRFAGAQRLAVPARSSVRAFSLSRPFLNSPSLKDAFYTTPSTLEVQGSVLGDQTAKTIEQWQAGLWARLEAEMQTNSKLADYLTHQQSLHKGTLSMTDLLSFLARDPSLSLAFNYASLLLNTSFFLEGLVKDTSAVQEVPAKFQGLEDQLVAQARGMVASGWLWIVSYRDRISTIPTYGSGTVLVRNRMQQGRDAATPLYYPTPSTNSDASSTSSATTQRQARPQEEDDYLSNTRDSDYQPIKPLAVINLFEHAYLARKAGDAGLDVWGKEQWVRDWFKLVDWAQVQGRAS